MSYERRYAGIGMERRGQRGPNDAVGSSYASILGANLVEMWHSQLGIATVTGNVDTWTGQIRGTVLQAPAAGQRPVYAADGANFSSKSVVQCAVSGSKQLRVTGLSGFLLSGTRPWIFNVVRHRAAAGGSGAFNFSFGQVATDEMRVRADPVSAHWSSILGPGGVFDIVTTAAAGDTVVHGFGSWPDGASLNITVDSTLTQAASVRALAADTTTIVLGSAITTNVVQSDSSHALLIVCAAYPGAAAAAQVLAMAKAEFGF